MTVSNDLSARILLVLWESFLIDVAALQLASKFCRSRTSAPNIEQRIADSLKRLQEGREDQQDALECQANVEAHPGVSWVDGLAAVRLYGLDPANHSSGQSVYDQLQSFFKKAVTAKKTWPKWVQDLESDQAIRRIDMRNAPVKWNPTPGATNSKRRSGSATVIVASKEIADLIYDARNTAAICHAGVTRITRTKKNVQHWELDQEQEPLEVACLEVIDIDSGERVERRKKGKYGEDCNYPATKLWSVAVTDAHVEFLKRSLVLMCESTKDSKTKGATVPSTQRISFQISSIQHIKCMADGRDGRFLGLRTRRPPHILTANGDDNLSGGTVGQQFDAALDPSDCEAFASPTAYYCPRFINDSDYEKFLELLRSFNLKIHRNIWVLSNTPSRHHEKGISHHLPALNKETKFLFPISLKDVKAAEDNEFRIQYFLECLLRHGHLRAADVPKLLQHLRTLQGWGMIGKFSDELHELARELPAVHRCNDGTAAFSKVKEMHAKALALQREARRYPVSLLQTSRNTPQTSSPDDLFARTPFPDLSVNSSSTASSVANSSADSGTHGDHACSSWHGFDASRSSMSPTASAGTPVATGDGGSAQAPHPEGGSGCGGLASAVAASGSVLVRKSQQPQDQVWLRKVLITPLRVLPYPETPEESNRILRQYAKFAHRFLRVGFANEALSGIAHFELSAVVEQRLRGIMLNGLRICNRRYKFLGYSNSQLKQHSCWLYCEDNRAADGAPAASHIREAAGNFNNIRVPSKYAARFAQCFSTTYETLKVKKSQVCTIPEVVAAKGEEFSDGIGVITSEGMALAIGLLPVHQQRSLQGRSVAAIQIRMGGCKGVLARWDGIKHMKKGAVVGVRGSMKKFDSAALNLEVCAVARVMACIINRQVIMALLSLGLDPLVLWQHYAEYSHSLDHLLHGPRASLLVLKAMGCVDPAHSSDLHVASGSLAACMVAAGVKPPQDPFLMSLVQAYRRFALKDIVEKCRMPVKEGVLLIGIMDETGTLPEGTFWASWDRPCEDGDDPYATRAPQPLPARTRALVSRNPVVSPADLRILHAADPAHLPEALTCLHNVVVFPKVGRRPEQCKMSGGDLDGDIFFIIWDKKLIPHKEAPAIDYRTDATPEEVPKGVTVNHMVDFFIKFVRNDQVGRICNFHLAIADASPVYANDDRCEKLARLNSVAVDFGKTGVPVDYTEVNEATGNVMFPDYMNGYRASDTVIGAIYRDALEKNDAEVVKSITLKRKALEAMHVAEGWAGVPGSEELREWAEEMLKEWTVDFSDMMSSYCLSDVGQVVTGRVLTFFGREAGREKNADHQARLNRHLAHLIHRYRTTCFPDVQAGDAMSVSNTDTTAWRSGAEEHRAAVAQLLAHRTGRNVEKDEGALEEVLCKVAALYEAAYCPPRTDIDRSLAEQEMLIRMALPWHMAPRQLAALISHGRTQGHAAASTSHS